MKRTYERRTNGSAGEGNGFAVPVTPALAARRIAAVSDEAPAKTTNMSGRRTVGGSRRMWGSATQMVAIARSTYHGPWRSVGRATMTTDQTSATTR